MSRFRNASNTRYLKALFFETSSDKSCVVYTLKDNDHEGYPSLRRLYLEEGDPLEISFAEKYLDGYEHWEMLVECTWFEPYAERWRKELELTIRSDALKNIILDSKSDSKSAASSNRFLVEGGWKPKATKGRPSKADIKKATKDELQIRQRLEDDYNRINLQ